MTKMQKTASVTLKVLGVLTIFVFGLLMGQHLHPDEPKELAVAGTVPVLLLDMVDARATMWSLRSSSFTIPRRYGMSSYSTWEWIFEIVQMSRNYGSAPKRKIKS